MASFDNREPEEFLLFVQNFQMMLEASGGLSDSAKIQYLSTLLRGEALRQLDMLSIEVGSIYDHNTFKQHYFGFEYVLFSY